MTGCSNPSAGGGALVRRSSGRGCWRSLIRFLGAWAQVTKKIRRHDEAEAERLIRMGMECLGLDDLGGHGKGSSEKIGLATFVKSRTIVTDLWIARRLQMGDPSRVSRYCAEAGRMCERSAEGSKKQEARTAPLLAALMLQKSIPTTSPVLPRHTRQPFRLSEPHAPCEGGISWALTDPRGWVVDGTRTRNCQYHKLELYH